MAEVAQAFLAPETTMAQRATRAKRKIAAATVPYRVPEAADLLSRLGRSAEDKESTRPRSPPLRTRPSGAT